LKSLDHCNNIGSHMRMEAMLANDANPNKRMSVLFIWWHSHEWCAGTDQSKRDPKFRKNLVGVFADTGDRSHGVFKGIALAWGQQGGQFANG